MSDNEFDEALVVINNEPFSSNKRMLSNHLINRNYLSLDQVSKVLDVFSFDSDRLEFAKKAYPKCIDQDRYYLLTNKMSFSSSRTELMEFINQ